MNSTFLHKTKKPTTKIENSNFPIVAIGASVGGLEAVSVLLKNLPSNTGMAFIYVQHLSPDHKSYLTSILSKLTKMKVQQIDDMELMKPNNVYIIPPNKGIKVTDGHIKLLPRLKINSTISIDVLFSSLAKTHKENVVGIVLSGYAKDGMKGLKAIKDAGGITFAQDHSAQVASMPNAAIAIGVVDFILSPKEIAIELTRFSKNNFKKSVIKQNNTSTSLIKNEETLEDNNADLKTIFELLFKETGVDFSHYKMPTIKRRLNHKMIQRGIKTTKEYVALLQKKNNEIDLLYNDLLINVTGFFRDKEVFKYLKTILLPKLLKSKTANDTLRIWVPACSSGQEAYSIAILLCELQENKTKKIPVQIFATDLSENIIKTARIGEYSASDISEVPQKYIKRFFTKDGDNYQIVKEVREMCVFAPHNILRDPPFSRMDFISCRNLLIYFDVAAQKRVFATLHFTLKDDGYLMLGKAETTGTASQLFTLVNTKLKIYSRKKNTGILQIPELTPRFSKTNFNTKKTNGLSKTTSINPTGIEAAIDSILLSRYTPACVVVNKDMEILQFRGPINLFLAHPSGKASLNILKISRPEFAFEMRNAIQKVIKTKQLVSKSDIEIKIESVSRKMTLEISPIKIDWDQPLLLIVFTLQQHNESDIEPGKGGLRNTIQKDKKIKALTDELNNTRSEINSIIELQEAIHEELQAANEEAVSSNEEFQTLNEELETSKEEIEATNEELISTNQELQMRNDLLLEAQQYSDAIISTIHEPMLILYKDFTVKSANKSFYKKFSVKKEETEEKLLFELGNKQWNIPQLRKMFSDIITKNNNFEDFEVTHTFPHIGEKTMLLNASLIIQKTHREQLILFAISDITEARKLAYELKSKENAKELIIANKKLLFQNTEKEKRAKELIIANKELAFQNEEKEKRAAELITANKELIFQNEEKVKRAAELAIADAELNFQNKEKEKREIINKELEEAKSKAEEAVKAKQQFLSNMSHEIRTPMNAIIGFTKVILKTDLTEKQKEYLSAIKVSGDALIVLINDILDLAKVDSGKMTFEKVPFKMKSSITSVLQLFEEKMQEKNLLLINEYDNKIPEILLGDYMRLHQIILNLISNAIKFTDKGEITFTARLVKEDDKKVCVEFLVSDTGIGIEKKNIETVFQKFHQATSQTSRLFGGTGLGLSIVKQLVEAQGGSIKVESKINKGSTFSFKLNFEKANDKTVLDIEPIELETKIKSIKVLVVEDVALNQLLMRTILDDFGFEHDIADNGKIAIEKMQTKTYDIVLMDLQMPIMNGFEATDYIRNTMHLDVPILALTADVTTVDVVKCKAIGMNDYIAKPVDERVLYAKIIGLVKKQQ
ncbi:MAG: CheR family methyltransferase [Bacteroidota bacterium]